MNRENVRHAVGDKVVALSDTPNAICQTRKKGSIYTVYDTTFCSKCGIQSINLANTTAAAFCECGLCGKMNASEGLEWTRSDQFAKLDELPDLIASYEEQGEYEMCGLLLGILNGVEV